jgi:hypothetical protein
MVSRKQVENKEMSRTVDNKLDREQTEKSQTRNVEITFSEVINEYSCDFHNI